ncbi:hypothetical protein FACS1894184_13190 [Clostridia bacterium]|nr:hypothetical protein FACS1894184_13190 [Clostridia bacterium]
MTDFEKAITFSHPEFIPVSVSLFKPTWQRHGLPLYDLVKRHPNLFPNVKSFNEMSNPPLWWAYETGKHTDHWGCEWDNLVEGHDSFCITHPLEDLDKVDELPIPTRDVGLEHGLLFLRLTFLRGYENAMIDFAEERPEFFQLIDKVTAYAERQTELRLREMKPDELVISYGDDLGTQKALPTGPEKWRKILKPYFARLFKHAKDAGKLVFMHTDGCIYDIIPDLKDCGVDIVNPQFRANGLDNLVRVTRGQGRERIAVQLDLDRQLFPFATPKQLHDHVMECTRALYTPEGGLSLFAELSEDVPLENIEALLEGLEEARVYR